MKLEAFVGEPEGAVVRQRVPVGHKERTVGEGDRVAMGEGHMLVLKCFEVFN